MLLHVIVLAASLVAARSLPQTCTTFANSLNLSSYNASVVNATYYKQGQYNYQGVTNNVGFCEVYSTVEYGVGNQVAFANWLPDAVVYRSRFLAVGNGEMAGVLDYADMLNQLNAGVGVAVTGSDGGHTAAANEGGVALPGVYLPFLHNQAQAQAWIHTSISIFTPVAKNITALFYGTQPAYSYFYGCSTGGAQGFSLAEFYPDLFDAIYAGSPGNFYSHLALSFLWNAQHTNTTATSLSEAQLQFITNASVSKCDGYDGLVDGLIENPLACDFDIDTLACNATLSGMLSFVGGMCLTDAEIGAMKAMYAGAVRSDNGKEVYPGFVFGEEQQLLLQEGALADLFTTPILQNLVFNDLAYDVNTFNWASDVDLVNERAGIVIDAIQPNLTAFQARGGKMISTQGWADPLNAPRWPIQHLDQINEFFGGSQDFYQLYMVPGGGHCGSALFESNVPDLYAVLPAFISWVEDNITPTAVKSYFDGNNPSTRKLCPWPSTAQYRIGSVNNWNSYECVSD